MIYGTLMTSVIALLIAVPVSFGIALFLTELSPGLAQAPAGYRHRIAGGRALDRLRHVGPAGVRPDPGHLCAAAAAGLFGRRAGAGRAGPVPPVGIGILSAGIILAIMIIPSSPR
jgi:phosphate transport system permease protein